MEIKNHDLAYLRLLAKQYPTIQTASTEIINLTACLHLPKGTEHFVSDIHGEYEAFAHVLRNGSGSIRRRIKELFANELTSNEIQEFATLIYYPERKLPLILTSVDEVEQWYRIALFRLIRICRDVSSKYTRAYVRKALPRDFVYIIEELLHEQEGVDNKHAYYQSVVDTIIEIGQGREFVIALATLIQHLAVAHLHVIGDIYDRGPGAHIIMDTLMDYHSVDVQWGNHDILWMGAAAGSEACIANVIRVSLRYANTETLETGYAISLLPLISFAVDAYADDPCTLFLPKSTTSGEEYTENEQRMMARMQKAIAVMQFKLEGQIIQRRPEYEMADRLLLEKIDYENVAITLDSTTYPLLDANFPTIDPDDPYALTPQEHNVIERLKFSFTNSERLQHHVRFLFSKGSLYLRYNGNLLYHGCVPMRDDGSFQTFVLKGQTHSPKAYLDHQERLARQGYFATDPQQNQEGLDAMWYLWTGAQSPLFGKAKMATFERYFISDKQTHHEARDPYYEYRDQSATARSILEEFGLDPDNGHIINGHVPVQVKRGESPIKCDGRLLVIDGGFAEAYHEKTGIAGYTLIANSYGLLLAAHEPFHSTQMAIDLNVDIHSETNILEQNTDRIRVSDTDLGRNHHQHIAELKELVNAYRTGKIKEDVIGVGDNVS